MNRPVQPAPAAAAQAITADAVEDKIKLAEAELEKELSMAVPAPQAGAEEEPFRPQSRLFAQTEQPKPPIQSRATPQAAPQPHAPAQQQAPAQSVEPVQAAPRMPRIEDFPPVVQAEVEHRHQQDKAEGGHDERGPMGLLKRLSSSLGRREDEDGADHAEQTDPAAERRPLSAEASLYVPKRGEPEGQGNAKTEPAGDDDQLEIPAFLRRQAMVASCGHGAGRIPDRADSPRMARSVLGHRRSNRTEPCVNGV